MKQSNKNNYSPTIHNDLIRDILDRLTKKASTVGATQHSIGNADPEDWSDLFALINEANGLLQAEWSINTAPTYTPGPWTLLPDTSGWTLHGGGGEVTTEAFDRSDGDANLISAAPELLEALEMILNETNAGTWDCLPVVNAKAAIAKAKGE